MPGVSAPAPLALWGGFECSYTRVGADWRDQLRETGHWRRRGDMARVASLGVRVLRYPVHWERLRNGKGWNEVAARIGDIRRRGMSYVAGLMHHGSGPAGLDLLHPDLGPQLARHAEAAARAFPDALAWTPVNEPLTTARFSCLYGVWYPHAKSHAAFLRATVNQCYATLLAMRAIRAVLPGAALLQTEDMTRVFATAPVADQARYENERRWLSLDLLCGRVDRSHPFHRELLAAGVAPAQLDALATGEAAPDIIGVNYYVTSERFLDHRTAFYPPHLRGGNGRQTYADTEAVRAELPAGELGWLPRLREVWARYRRPMVISEAHLGCQDEAEQARWFAEAWGAARQVRDEGADLRAVTAWALVGSMDWDSLMRERRGSLECGLWQPGRGFRPRLLAQLLPEFARGGAPAHPALRQDGWWRREDRIPERWRA